MQSSPIGGREQGKGAAIFFKYLKTPPIFLPLSEDVEQCDQALKKK
jgi:hypothetical protein